MADALVLKNSAIVRHATVGAPPPHGPVKTGALPQVQVRMVPGGPQVQRGQQQPVEILAPRDAQSAVAIGGLPLVKVKMDGGKAIPDDGRGDQRVVIRDAKSAGVNAGGLPIVQVKMDGGQPQVQTLPTVAGGPPQIQAAPPALSAPRNGMLRQTIAAPRQAVALPVVPVLTTEQMMLCRHRVEKYLTDLQAIDAMAPEAAADVENIKLAEATISTLDEVMIATAVRAAAAEEAAVNPVPVSMTGTRAFAAETSISPAPSGSYVAGRIDGRPTGFTLARGGTGRSQRNSMMAPRRVARPGSLPPVIVKMEGKMAVVQNKAEIDAAKAAMASAEADAQV